MILEWFTVSSNDFAASPLNTKKRSESTINISGLNPAQIDILESLIYYFRKNEMLDAICLSKAPSYELLIETYSNMINKEKYELIRKMFTTEKISE